MSFWRMMMAPSVFARQDPASGATQEHREEGLRLLNAHADSILTRLSRASEQEPAVPGFEPALTDARLAEWVA
ncbi:hypothetical protein NOG11_07925 [Parvularcula sp. BGMRC 0090]|uniref:Uncharacterized protein n=2 Tax=Parvularcula maris TaxID=2965077 RepID=A0A9X2L904_9PROT|nr:hypothetical protein [Parvularcula maris]